VITPTTDELLTALNAQRWAAEVADQAPFDTLDQLLDAAHDATPLTTAEIDEAISHHPRIGEKPIGDSASAAHSRSEQGISVELADEIAAANAAYEKRFGRVFIIRAAGRSRAEILSEATRRTALDDDTELAIVGEQLRDIALLRLEAMFA